MDFKGMSFKNRWKTHTYIYILYNIIYMYALVSSINTTITTLFPYYGPMKPCPIHISIVP